MTVERSAPARAETNISEKSIGCYESVRVHSTTHNENGNRTTRICISVLEVRLGGDLKRSVFLQMRKLYMLLFAAKSFTQPATSPPNKTT